IIYLVSFFSGFLSLSLEIIWMRIISFAGMSVPQAFSYTLALFLMGIAIGAQIGKFICKRNTHIKINILGNVFIISASFDIFILSLIYFSSKVFNVSILFLGLCVFICAGVRGIIFPLVHHIGTAQTKTGAQVSNVYFLNVFGSASAPILISFIALDYLNTQQVYLFICFLTFGVAFLCLSSRNLKMISAATSLITLLLLTIPEKIIYELSRKDGMTSPYPSQILENKHGFIQVYNDEKDQIVFGANVYDGKLNTNIFNNTNDIDRAYLLTAIKPDATEILVIGLSTGSWVKVLSMMPNLKKITVIEINPAYIDLIKTDPIVSDILKDKRIEIIFDDGRKWIKKNQGYKYDIILMNTTWNWRAYASNLLSKDFLNIVEKVIKPKGILFYNTTQSSDAYYTASKTFPYTYKYKFMVLNSFQPVELNIDNVQKELCKLKRYSNMDPIFKNREECYLAADIILKVSLIPYNEINFSEFSSHQPELITDDNMISEYKYGKGL
ncbi:fused MFS/spermidine synthase, partial [Acinetobacter bereziniae]|uniref:fused MFS/spermidine synthase n=1 Tax=Acinetobacter bereziniae TaxID=106648 RepID=UPI00196B24CF